MTSVDGASGGSPVLVERRGAICVLTLNRPKQANAFNAALLRELHEATEAIAADEGIRAVLLTGAGRHFCAGADLREPREQRRASRARYGEARDLSRLPQPVVAAINGPALGGGCETALTCDFRFMAADASIGLPEIRFGALPLGGGTARLPRLVGLPAAKRLIMTGEPVTADEALRIGLADHVTAPGEVVRAAEEFAGQLIQHADYALRAAKEVLNRTLEMDLPAALELEREVIAGMATPQEYAAARTRAAERFPAYTRIFADRAGPPAAEKG